MDVAVSPKFQRCDVIVPVDASENLTFNGALPLLGVAENPATGGTGAVIANPLVSIPDFPSGLMTPTFHGPAVLPVRLKVQVILVGETIVTLVPPMSVYPVRFSLTVAPAKNPVPVRFVMLMIVVFIPVFGVIDVILGGDTMEFTVIYPIFVEVLLPLGPVTVRLTVYVPAAVYW